MLKSRRDPSPGRSDAIPKRKITQIVFQKCKSLSKKMQVKPAFSFVTSNGRPGASKRKESSYVKVRSMLWKAGIGTRFRNIWNGRWWVHVRFCSVRCEGIYEVKQNDAANWHTFPRSGNIRS